MREAPHPDYSYDVQRLTREYEKALRNIQAELNTLFLTDFERAQIVAVEENIKAILRDLNRYGSDWARQTITQSAREGVASTIYSLGLADTFEEALKIARFSSLNKPLVEAIITDTQADLLAVTQNVSRKTRSAVRQATADVLRAKTSAGINGTQSLQQALTKELRKQLGSAADTAIVSANGARWRLKPYVEMLVRTKTMQAHKEASINEALDRDVQYGVISRHGATDACRNWEGRIVAYTPDAPGGFPYIGDLPRNEIFHPNCRHLITPVRRPDRLPADIREVNGI
ncbi:phage minor capsid protein [Sporosarcina sp. SAFN-015]|uniref:phage minor capsid protein n=1 Tax=Sporosarcina sp. SAFN-015 TaxID=3387274 RepID=UPI003F7E21A2